MTTKKPSKNKPFLKMIFKRTIARSHKKTPKTFQELFELRKMSKLRHHTTSKVLPKSGLSEVLVIHKGLQDIKQTLRI